MRRYAEIPLEGGQPAQVQVSSLFFFNSFKIIAIIAVNLLAKKLSLHRQKNKFTSAKNSKQNRCIENSSVPSCNNKWFILFNQIAEINYEQFFLNIKNCYF
jgi:hypothetical protein